MNNKIAEMKLIMLFSVAVCVAIFSGTAFGFDAPLNIAFYYAANPPVNELKAFDVVVVDPDSGITPVKYGAGPSRLFAYISVGEAQQSRNYTKQMDAAWLIGDNQAWKSRVVDVSSPAWREFFLDKVVEPLWQAGYRGFFLDTLDSYQLAVKKDQFAAMESGLVTVVRALHERHPEANLILNRGFEIFDRVKDVTFAVAAESLYRNFNPLTGKYGEVSEGDREWLLGRMNSIRKTGIPVIAIDYVPPGNREIARQTAEKIKNLGFSPWVTDKGLASLGVGTVEVMPRVVLGLYDGAEGKGDAFFTNIQRFVVMPLNYMGYTVKLHDMREALPEGVLTGRYAGAIVWPYSRRSGEQRGLKDWTLKTISDGLPVLFLERFGVNLDDEFVRKLGLELSTGVKIIPPAKVLFKDSSIGFEHQPMPQTDTFIPLRLKQGKPLLVISAGNKAVNDAVAITPWGGYALAPYVVTEVFDEQTAWVLNPFVFIRDALRLPEMPVPDTTTENGVRLLLSHVDGDGFESRAEWPGGKLAAEELRSQILEKYRIPVSISLITSSFNDNKSGVENKEKLENIARGIMLLPNVEGASHSFSHPFRWKPDQKEDAGTAAEVWHTINIPGYNFNLDDEIEGSLNYINNRIMPVGKTARLFHWTGNCLPGEEAVLKSYQAGALNINGGDTVITDSNRSIRYVAPLGIQRGDNFQVFAPNQNENVYTNLWTENFYGYRRVLETFRLTDLPRRLKPVNIYYHFYSATKTASIGALKTVHNWAVGQHLFSIFTSDYVEKVLDFNRTVIARDSKGWLVRNSGKLREMRIPGNLGYPDLGNSSHVAGYSDHGDSRYLHLTPGGEARIVLQPAEQTKPYLISAGGYLDTLERSSRGIRLSFTSSTPFIVRLGNVSGCRLTTESNRSKESSKNELSVDLTEGKHALAIDCP